MEKLINHLKDSLKEEEILKELKKIYGTDFKNMFNFFYNLPKNKLESISHISNIFRENNFERRKQRLLGTKSKAMPDFIFKKVLEHFSSLHEKRYKVLKMIYEVQGVEGMRIGDLLELKTNNIDFISHEITLINHKSRGRIYTIPMAKQVEEDLKEYINEFEDDIKKHDNYLFFSNAVVTKHKNLSQQYVNRELVAYLEEEGLEKVYAIDRKGRKRRLFTTHSERGHAATTLFKKTNGNIRAVQKLLDHSPKSISTTGVYIQDEEDLVYKVMRE